MPVLLSAEAAGRVRNLNALAKNIWARLNISKKSRANVGVNLSESFSDLTFLSSKCEEKVHDESDGDGGD
jgi:hypothetical protein